MYGRIVLGIAGEEFDTLLEEAKERLGADLRRRGPAPSCCATWSTPTSRSSSDHTGAPFPQDPDAQLRGAIEAVFRLLERAPRHRLPRPRGHPPRPRHGRQRPGHGVRQPRRPLGHRRRLHPRPGHRGQGRVRRLPGQRPGRGRGGRHPQHRAALGAEGDASPRSTPSCWPSSPASSATTATCATPSSPSSRASSGCSRPGWASAPGAPRCAWRST